MQNSLNPLLLAVDSGNTHIKWELYDGSHRLNQGVAAQGKKALLAQEWAVLEEPSRIMVSNVAGAHAGSDLSELFTRWKTHPEWIRAVAYQCGVRNYYADPARLGSDRWAALIGAWESERQGCLVVDAGTAMTVDALTDTGEFLGGIITPGIDLMQQILMRDIVSLKSREGKFCDYPDSTADAICSGAVHAMAGAIERMAVTLAGTLGRVPDCILCGGSAQQLLPQLNVNAKVVDNLVLQGLLAIARENPQAAL
ncbi:MAG: type III pantothenate kinase [Nitrosospira sp.]